MVRFSFLLPLCVGISSYIVNVDAAKKSLTCEGNVSPVKPSSSSASISSISVNVNAPSSSGTAPSASASFSFPRSSPYGVRTASYLVTRSAVSCSASASAPRWSVSASSSRPSESASSSPLTTATTNTCPPHSTSTRTHTMVLYKASSPEDKGIVTITSTAYTTTITATIGDVRTYITTAYPSTVTTTSTTTVTGTIVVIPASYTTTVPTPDNFTPLLCLPRYLDPTVTLTTTSYYAETTTTAAITLTSFFSTATTYSIVASEITVTVPGSGIFTTTAIDYTQITATRADATSTVYAACASNNVSPRGPFNGENIYNTLFREDENLEAVNAAAVDFEDCCAQCQANPSCVISTSNSFFVGGLTCTLYLRPTNITAVCSPTAFSADLMTVGFWSPLFFLSNGPCGQVNYITSDVTVEFDRT